MDEAAYVTFGVPAFEKRQQKSGFFSRFVSRHKTIKSDESEESKDFLQPKVVDTSFPISRQTSPLKRRHLPVHSTSSGAGQLPVDRRYWMLDESCRQCFECGSHFTTLLRKHHCRMCGRIFCYQCSSKSVEGEKIGMSGLQRVCNYCASSLPCRPFGAIPSLQKSGHSFVPHSNLERSPVMNAVFNVPHSVRTRHGSSDSVASRPAAITNVSDTEAILSAALTGRPQSDLSNLGSFPVRLGETDVSVVTNCSHSPIAAPTKWTPISTASGETFCGILHTQQTPTDSVTTNASVLRRGVSRRTNEIYTDTYIRSLLTRMLGTADHQDLVGSETVTKKLPTITISQDAHALSFVSGIGLIYWLISNVPEVQRCRSKARSICQRFVDLSLITPLNTSDVGEFHDDFTPYRIACSSISPSAGTSHHGHRVSWPPSLSSPPIESHNSGGLDEPEWLREIEASLPHSYPPVGILPDSSQVAADQDWLSSTQVAGTHLLPSDESFEIGVDVRLTEGTNRHPSVSALALSGSTADLLNSTFVRRLSNSTAGTNVDSKLSSSSQDLHHSIRPYFEAYLQRLVLQDVRSNHLDPSWVPILISLSHKVCDLVRFDLRSSGFRSFASAHNCDYRNCACDSAASCSALFSPMDIRYYVHVKKLLDASGYPSDVFPGVVFTKRATHKFMPCLLKDARVLLLASCIDYQRALAKMVWLESQIMQEEEYLSNCVSRLLCFHPNLLIVGDTVSYTAQMMLVKAGITVLCNVRRSVLLRIARVTGADIIESVDRLISEVPTKSLGVARAPPQLGYTQRFEVKPVCLSHNGVKFLSYVKNLADAAGSVSAADILALSGTPRYTTDEATVMLRGPDLATLKRVKRCFFFALCACSNIRFEMQYTMSTFMYQPSRQLGPGFTSTCSSVTQSPDPCSLMESSRRKPKIAFEPQSTLAHYLSGHLFSLSPSVHFALPFFTFANEQQAPLGAYYTYIVEWPFGRVLNDLLKTKLKVIGSNMYALKRENRAAPTLSTGLSLLPDQHDFLKCNLVFHSSSLLRTLENQVPKRSTPSEACVAIDKSAYVNAFLMSEVIAPQSEALYVDFKARAFAPTPTDALRSSRSIPSTIIDGLKHLISVYDSPPRNVRDKHPDCRSFHKSGANKTNTLRTLLAEEAVESRRAKRLKRSILDPRSHQCFSFLTLLFSSKSPMWPEPCVQPWISSVEFYGQQDLPLGLFLEKCCFSPRPCRHPHCALPMVDHVQRFVQTDGYVQLSIHKCTRDSDPSIHSIANAFPGSVRPPSRILMWLFCPVCRISTPLIYLSGDLWHYSFVKFLDNLINTPSDWAQYAMRRTMVSTVVGITPANVKTAEHSVDIGNQKEASRSNLCSLSIPTALTCQSTCIHSSHNTLEHCFSFGRKVAVFQYHPATIYEVVMPPNEIRMFPSAAAAAAARLFVSDQLPHVTQLMSASNSSSVLGCQISEPEHQFSKPGSITPFPAYLHAEAVNTWEKYYRAYTTVKSYLITLVQDNANPELSQMLEDYVFILEKDNRRSHMEYRAELLRFLIESETKQPSVSQAGNEDSSSPCSSLAPPSSKLASQRRVPLDVRNQDAFLCRGETMLSSILQDESKSNEQLLSSSVSLPTPHSPSASSASNMAGVTAKGESQSNTSGATPKWTSLLCNLGAAEKTYILQTLINELKRWIYVFISEWNTRCGEYDMQLRRAEKAARELRKKPGATHGCSSPFSQRHLRKSHLSVSESGSISAYDSESLSNCDRATPPLLVSTDDHTNSINFFLSSDLSTHQNNPLLPFAGGALPFDISDKASSITCDSPTTATISRVWSDDAAQSLYLGSPRLRHSGSNDPAASGSSADSLSKFCASSDSISPRATLTVLTGDRLSEEEQLDALQKSDSRLSPILDPLNPKVPASYSTMNLVTLSSSPTPSSRLKSPHVQPPETIVQACGVSAVPSSLTVTSGMRRLINTLIPGSNDVKVFDEPFPPHEHPQLTLTDGIITGLFGLSNGTLAVTYPAENRSLSNVDDYMCHLIHSLKLTPPDVYVSDRELTSIIAFALSTPEYERHLVDLHADVTNQFGDYASVQTGQSVLNGIRSKDGSSETLLPVADPACGPEHGHTDASCSSASSILSTDEQAFKTQPVNKTLPCSMSHPSSAGTQHTSGTGVSVTDRTSTSNNRHIKLQFSDSSTNFYCCVYYAAEFFRLRQLLLPQGDVGFVRSLSRCFQWDARGGKSGSLFMKTRDERFVIKELSTIEMKTFHEISQQYFEYLISTAIQQRLCVLSRILGIFHVEFKNTLSVDTHRSDVLVMENLFHDRMQLSCIYDLKGSLRKRLVDEASLFRPTTDQDSTETQNETTKVNSSDSSHMASTITEARHSTFAHPQKPVPVLLDQNLLNSSIDNPLYLRVHSKNALSHCLRVETEFLANLFLMDYSLLVGIDPSTNQLVVGLIDYLRKFTFDKRMEMMIKQTITSAQAPPPTILTPDLYRERFLMQMDNYFILVPDHWYDSMAEHTEAWQVRRCAQLQHTHQPILTEHLNL